MPPYAEQLGSLGSRLGRAGGGAAGAVGGGLLGHLLGMLDYPRQAAANLFAGPAEGNWEKAIPGAVGLLAPIIGSALAPVTGGLSLPAAIGLGSLAGGTAQGILSNQLPDTFKAPTTEEITGSDNPVLNFAAGALMDPLTYAGGIGGAGKGAKVGSEALGDLGTKIGARMEELAPGMGAGYGSWFRPQTSRLEGLLSQIEEHPNFGSGSTALQVDRLRNAPKDVRRAIAGEIPSGSTLRNLGAESAAFQTPAGGIAKLTIPRDFTQPAFDIPEMLQSPRIAEAGNFSVSHQPRLIPGTDLPEGLAISKGEELDSALKEKGIRWWDKAARNLGVDPATEKAFILDPGSVKANTWATPNNPILGGELPVQRSMQINEQPQSLLEKYILAPMIQRDIRREIAAKTGSDPALFQEYLSKLQDAPTNVGVSPPLSGPAPVPQSRLERMLRPRVT